jgi:branched-chain amino acid aminotransferase
VGHYTNSILATTEAKHNGYDEALLTDMNGHIAEGPGANFFMEKDGKLFTAPLGNILAGITRATVIELAQKLNIPLEEKFFTPEEVKTADAAFYCGTAAEVIGIESLDEYTFPKNWKDTKGAIIQRNYMNLVLHKELELA